MVCYTKPSRKIQKLFEKASGASYPKSITCITLEGNDKQQPFTSVTFASVSSPEQSCTFSKPPPGHVF